MSGSKVQNFLCACFSPFQPNDAKTVEDVKRKKENGFFLNYWHNLNEVFDNPWIEQKKHFLEKNSACMMHLVFSKDT